MNKYNLEDEVFFIYKSEIFTGRVKAIEAAEYFDKNTKDIFYVIAFEKNNGIRRMEKNLH